MTTFPAFATNFDMYPREGESSDSLSGLVRRLARVDFVLRVVDPSANQGQMDSNFDGALEQNLLTLGASSLHLPLPPEIPQELDFAFEYAGRCVEVEIEKANR